MTTEQLSIGEVAVRTGMTPDALRYYHRLGLLPPASRTAAGYRLYDRSALDRLTFIRKARALGLRLGEVREILRVADRGTPPCEHVRVRGLVDDADSNAAARVDRSCARPRPRVASEARRLRGA